MHVKKLCFRTFHAAVVRNPSNACVHSGGAVHSPHLLMLSGVGPSGHLKKFNIPVIKDQPNVGQNLVDHPVIDVYFKDKNNNSAQFLQPKSLGDVVKLVKAIRMYSKGFGGPLAMNVRSLTLELLRMLTPF